MAVDHYHVEVLEGQSLIDLAMQEFGTPDGAWLLLEDNEIPELTSVLTAGQRIKVQLHPRDLAKEIVEYVRKGRELNVIVEGTGLSLEEMLGGATLTDIKSALIEVAKLAGLLQAYTSQEVESYLPASYRNQLTGGGLIPTGSSTSYSTGDDAYYIDPSRSLVGQGLADFFTLRLNSRAFGHNKRFAGVTGGYYYSGGYFNVDGSVSNKATAFPGDLVYDQATSLLWYANLFSPDSGAGKVQSAFGYTWANALTQAAAYTTTVNGITFQDWLLPNRLQLLSMQQAASDTNTWGWVPFSLPFSWYAWSSSHKGANSIICIHPEMGESQFSPSDELNYFLCHTWTP